MALTPQRFIDALRDYSLLEPDDLSTLEADLTAVHDAIETPDLARRLVQAGKLTEYQVTVISDGAANSLVYGEYIVLDKLGAGGMGRVFKARHRRMKRLVALKILPGEAMQDPSAVLRFGREVEAAATLNHPNIVTAFDAGEANGVHFLAMEYVEGQDLLAIARQRGMLPLAEALDYVIQAARGLAYAHARRVIHRDIKPANLLLDLSGTVKVLDMGVARFTHPAGVATREITVSGEVMGSADYMAPEQATDVRQADARADIYSLGFSLYRMLTGAIPYAGESFVQKVLAHREQAAPSLSARRPDVTPAIEAIYLRMVAKRPEDRYRNMNEVIAALEPCLRSLPPAARLPLPSVASSTPEDETLGRSMFERQQAALRDREIDSGRSFVSIALDKPSAASAAPVEPAPVRRKWRVAPIIAGAAVLSVVVVACVALFKKDRQPSSLPGPVNQLTRVTSGASPFIDPSTVPFRPVPGTLPATSQTAPVLPPASSPSPPVTQPSVVSADRRVAEWAIHLGGQVGVRPPGNRAAIPIWINSIPFLPSEDYRVTRVMVYQIKAAKIIDSDLEKLRELTELEDLNLGGCVSRVTDRGLGVLGQIKSLDRLNLDGAGITDEGIGRLRPLSGLSVLSLSSTGITDRGIESLREMHRFQRLYLNHTAVTDAVALMPGKCWPLLRILELDSTGIDDAGLVNLKDCPALTSLSVRDTSVTPDGIARFRQALPKCKVDWGTTSKPATNPALR